MESVQKVAISNLSTLLRASVVAKNNGGKLIEMIHHGIHNTMTNDATTSSSLRRQRLQWLRKTLIMAHHADDYGDADEADIFVYIGGLAPRGMSVVDETSRKGEHQCHRQCLSLVVIVD